MLDDMIRDALAATGRGDLAQAEALYARIVAQAPSPEALVNYGNVLNRLQRPADALAQYDRALALAPALLPALFNRGNALLELGRADDAVASYDKAAALNPSLVGIWNNRGTALRGARRLGEALASFERAIVLDPRHANALTNRAIALHDLKRFDEALTAADAALAAAPGFAEALYVKANALGELGRLEEALGTYEQARAANPNHPHALNGMARMALTLCDWDRTAALQPQLETAIRDGRVIIQPFTMLGYTDDPALQYRAAQNAIRRLAPARAPLATGKYRHDKIRLAYLSADFHGHATAVLMAELFERHDRTRFDVSAIAFGPDDGSPMRARLRAAFERFDDVRGMSDLEVARMLRERETDIAVDLNAHTMDARPGIFAHKPAPVQVNYLVYPGTTGAAYMDFIIADRVVLPLDQQPFYSEKIVHLPDCYQANDATRVIGPAPSRAEAGLPDSGFVFCCFNNNWKITAPVFDIWMRLLAQVDGSVLWLLDGPGAPNLRRAAQKRGIDPSRLVFAPKAPPEAHLARHQLADLFLDTLPYNAHTTASDALWSGVPLVTCIGKVFQSRVAASLLKAIGLPELVTQTPAAYEALALELARNPALLAATREKLRRNRLTTPLYDSARFTANIEAAYEAMLR
jgi:predicted O-linked N-acetylglucosamine transferase (SPINDLY family)